MSTTMRIAVKQQKRVYSVLQQDRLILKPDIPNYKCQQTRRHITVTRRPSDFCTFLYEHIRILRRKFVLEG